MKPQKKAVVGRKATGTTTLAKKRRVSPDKLVVVDPKSEKKVKKLEKPEETRRKLENERKRQEKPDDKKKQQQQEERRRMDNKSEENKKRMEEKRKEDKMEKLEEKRKQNRDNEKRLDKLEEKRNERSEERGDEREVETHDNAEKKKMARHEEKTKVDNLENGVKYQPSVDDKESGEDKVDSVNLASKKKNKEEKRKDAKVGKPESKENFKSMTKDNKKLERKKTPDKEISRKSWPAGLKKDTKVKQTQKKAVPKKTVLVKKMASHSAVVGKKLLEKNVKLVKASKSAPVVESEEDEETKKKKKKNSFALVKGKVPQDKGPKLAKQMKAKIGQKQVRMSATLKKEGKLKRITEKIVMKKKVEAKESEKITSEIKKASGKDESVNQIEANNIKREIDENKEERTKDEKCQGKLQDSKKSTKNAIRAKVVKKPVKKITKPVKTQSEESDRKSTSSDEVTLDELLKQSKVAEEALKGVTGSRQEHGENLVKTDLKVEAANAEANSSSSGSSNSDDEEENQSPKKTRRRMAKKKERKSSPSDERARRMRLFGFWSGPKRHRVASLNALAKVHCLYENEAGGVYLGGFCKPKPEKEKQKKAKEEKEESKDKDKEKENNLKKNESTEENAPKRKLRNVPGLRGKHWDMIETSSSSSSSSDEDYEQEKSVEPNKKKVVKRRKKNEEVMDLKDMVVCKRMASLNASAILAASYSDEKNRQGSSSSSSSSNDSTSESEVEVIKRRKQSDSEVDKRKSRQGSDSEEVIKPSKKVVIVNQDTDVTITGVYVNQTRSTHHEGFCSIAGMQYRISSTSHTQTAATAVATELHDQPKLEQPCKSYTPLGALSSMQPPGSQGNHPPMSPRRHSAFSAPHQHGYYQPAGPLIQHPPTLPPVKGPPPEPTPTPPQNSEGSDDLVATSTTSGGTSSSGNGGFYRAYCPQYYGTPPQYQELCYPPTYSHPHPHPPPYYKYAPTYRRQYYGYQESGGAGGPGGGGAVGGPGVVEYQPPPPSAEYPPPPYYGGYPPPPPPPPPNPAYLHTQGRPFVDHAAFQGCPCPMQSCPKNVDTGPLIGNGKGAPVVSGPGLSLPPSALVGPPSPARGLAGLAPPHGANAWDTDRVQINTHRNLNQNQPPLAPTHSLPGGPHVHPQNLDCRTKDEKTCQDDKLRKCSCQKHACTSTCEVKMETLSPTDKLTVTTCPTSKLRNFKLENNNVKCESCSVESVGENLPCAANCEVKCESGYKCEIIKCEQCMKEGQMTILEIDKDSGILMIDDKLETEPDVKEEMNDVVVIENENWKKPDYESTVQETVEDKETSDVSTLVPEEELQPRCQKVTKRKLSLDSLSDNIKKRKVNKRTLSVGSARDLNCNDPTSRLTIPTEILVEAVERVGEPCATKKKQAKKEVPNQKRKTEGSSPCETPAKKPKSSKQTVGAGCVSNCLKNPASETSIMETINNVIQQSLQMTQRKDRKIKSDERVDKKKSVNLISTTLKKVTKKMDQVKAAVSEKLSFAKCETKFVQPKSSKVDAKSKTKTQDAKSKTKVKAKIVEVKCKVLDSKSKVQDLKSKDTPKRHEIQISKPKVTEIFEESKKACLVKKRRKSTKKTSKKSCKMEDSLPAEENLSLIRKPYLKPKWSNGWSWEGESYEAKVYLTNEESAIRRCYTIMKHESGDVLRPRDCVLLKSGPRKADLPFVAKIAALWENPDDGEMMFSLLWYYRPEHTEQGRTEYDTEDEVFASRHRDANSVACIEDKCYILTFNEYCRYRKNLRRIEEGLESPGLIVPRGDQVYPREHRQPPIPVPSDMVLFCRRVYDYRGKKLVKNPG